jgi:Na+/proline symporter
MKRGVKWGIILIIILFLIGLIGNICLHFVIKAASNKNNTDLVQSMTRLQAFLNSGLVAFIITTIIVMLVNSAARKHDG